MPTADLKSINFKWDAIAFLFLMKNIFKLLIKDLSEVNFGYKLLLNLLKNNTEHLKYDITFYHKHGVISKL